jgi:hypothetical protein
MSDTDQWNRVLESARGVRVAEAKERSTVWIDTSDPAALQALRAALRVAELPGGHCMCPGDELFELMDESGRPITTATLHHGRSLRWEGWTGDGILEDGRRVLDWMAEQGHSAPRERFLEDQRAAGQWRALERQWLAEAPLPLRALGEKLLAPSREGIASPELLDDCRSRLLAAYPDSQERTRALLDWNSRGTGRCSGHPAHERVPGELLAELPIQDIIEALQGGHATGAQLAGALRHLVSWKARPKKKKKDLGLLPQDLRQRLLDLAEQPGHEDKRHAARNLLGPGKTRPD